MNLFYNYNSLIVKKEICMKEKSKIEKDAVTSKKTKGTMC